MEQAQTIVPRYERPLYAVLASLVQARINCIDRNNQQWLGIHTETIGNLVKEHMPSGSGFDNGTDLDLVQSNSEKLVFHTAFHHMNDVGMYAWWTDHTVTVRPSLWRGITMTISGRDRNGWKDMAYEAFDLALRVKVA